MKLLVPFLVSLSALALAGAASADALPNPSVSATLNANPNPWTGELGGAKFYAGGALTGLAFSQDNPVPGDNTSAVDVSNGQVWLENTSGPVQVYVQAGAYSLPSLGTPYLHAADTVNNLYGVVPVAWVKLAPTSEFSIQVGKLPTLIGAESTFTFQNMNIDRGLLWNQEPAISRGVQANYAKGPISLSVSLNDGFYSNKYNWVSAALTYTVGKQDTVEFIGAGNTGRSTVSTFATPYVQNNSQIYNVIWTHTQGPWVVQPYFQYTRVPASAQLFIPHEATATGWAALAKYSFSPTFNLAGRAEWINSTGSLGSGAPNLLYGPGSNAWSLTLTPTYQVKSFFIRGEAAYVQAGKTTPGFVFGPLGTKTSQTRGVIETGFLF